MSASSALRSGPPPYSVTDEGATARAEREIGGRSLDVERYLLIEP
jgi:hypothetical protein